MVVPPTPKDPKMIIFSWKIHGCWVPPPICYYICHQTSDILRLQWLFAGQCSCTAAMWPCLLPRLHWPLALHVAQVFWALLWEPQVVWNKKLEGFGAVTYGGKSNCKIKSPCFRLVTHSFFFHGNMSTPTKLDQNQRQRIEEPLNQKMLMLPGGTTFLQLHLLWDRINPMRIYPFLSRHIWKSAPKMTLGPIILSQTWTLLGFGSRWTVPRVS